jgi:formamidopyrimidine-DNA glycosylase
VRRGLERGVAGRTVADVVGLPPAGVRRHLLGAQDFGDRLAGPHGARGPAPRQVPVAPLDSGDALTGHLGMSGQLLVVPGSSAPQKHLHVRIRFSDATVGAGPGAALRRPAHLRRAARSCRAATRCRRCSPHIARDPLDPEFDDDRFVDALRRRRTGLKRALLDQTLVSGIGNIYADETLWRARLHGERPTDRLTRPAVRRLLGTRGTCWPRRWWPAGRASTRSTSRPRA